MSNKRVNPFKLKVHLLECEADEKDQKIADLEAKLADTEFRYENLHNLYYKDAEELKQQLAEYSKHHEWVSEFLERYKIDLDSTPEYSENPMIEYCEQVYDFRLCDNVEIKDLQEQLAEYKKDNEQLEDRLHTAEQETLHFQNKCFDMQHQLAEKDKEIEQWKSMAERSSSILDRFNYCGESIVYNTTREQDKISFAVEQLEKVKENIHYLLSFDYNLLYRVNEQIDNQIKHLKEIK